jgi:hypothetical protein
MGKYLDIFRGPPAVRAGSVAKQLHWGYDKNDLSSYTGATTKTT